MFTPTGFSDHLLRLKNSALTAGTDVLLALLSLEESHVGLVQVRLGFMSVLQGITILAENLVFSLRQRGVVQGPPALGTLETLPVIDTKLPSHLLSLEHLR